MTASRIDLERALEAVEPTTNAARVREVMPVIERKLAAGVRLAELLAALRGAGLDLTEATLRTYIYRYRKEVGRPAKWPAPVAMGPGACAVPAAPAASIAEASTAPPPDSLAPTAVSKFELSKLTRPDPVENAQRAADLERIGMQLWRDKQKKTHSASTDANPP